MIKDFNTELLKELKIPLASSHKGQNGKLLIIGGSRLFHAASLWSLSVASKVVDMVFYSSVPENNTIVQEAKSEFRNGIIVTRDQLESYVIEADAILIGPGMVRMDEQVKKPETTIQNIQQINELTSEGEQTYYITKYLLQKYPQKKWVIDAGALQMLDLGDLAKLEHAILTPHMTEFVRVFSQEPLPENVALMAKKYHCTILRKGEEDIVASIDAVIRVKGGNAGMTKGGTGDVLAGLTAALFCTNDAFLSTCCASYINKKAGESLYEKVGLYFNSSDLVEEIPYVMKKLLL